MIIYCIISAFLNAITGVALGLMLLVRGRPGSPNFPLFLFLIAGSLWSSSYVVWLLSGDAASALFWARMLSGFAILIPAAYVHFCLRLVGDPRNGLVRACYTAALVLAALCATPWIVREVAPIASFPFWPRPGVGYVIYLLFFAGATMGSWALLLSHVRRASHARRNQLRFALISTTIGFLGGSTNFLYWFDIPIPPVGNALGALYLIGVAYTIIGLRLLEVNYVVAKTLAYVLVAAPLALFHPCVFLTLYLYTGDVWQTTVAWLGSSLVLAFAAVLIVPHLKRRVDALLERTLLKHYFTGRDRLRDFGTELTSFREESEMFERSAEAVASALGTGAALYLRGELDRHFRLLASCQIPAGIVPPDEIPDSDPLLAFARRWQRAFIIDEIVRLEPDLAIPLAGHRAKYRIEVVVPVISGGVFFGMLLLSARHRHRVYSDNEVALLDSLCQQIGLQVRARQLERRANQTEKLISLGTLAAGLAHELRNPLVSIKTFAQLLAESPGDRELQHEFSSTVLRDVGRVESIVENVAAFATDRKVAFAWIRLDDVVHGAYDIVRPACIEGSVAFDFDAGETPHVHGNQNQLTQVVINLLNNAVQAIAGRDGARVLVRSRHRAHAGAKPSVELSIADNGPGIAPEIRDHLFEPFTTTKNTGDRARKGGMGLGLAIVKRIVDGHNGVIRVDSEPARGTTFTIVLPCETTEG